MQARITAAVSLAYRQACAGKRVQAVAPRGGLPSARVAGKKLECITWSWLDATVVATNLLQ